MPNWIEGTMKLRGKREDIYRFFKEGLEPSSWAGESNKIEEQVLDYSGEEYNLTGEFYFFNGYKYTYIGPITEATITTNAEDTSNECISYTSVPEESTFEFVMGAEVWKNFVFTHRLFTNNWLRMHGFRAVRRRRRK